MWPRFLGQSGSETATIGGWMIGVGGLGRWVGVGGVGGVGEGDAQLNTKSGHRADL